MQWVRTRARFPSRAQQAGAERTQAAVGFEILGGDPVRLHFKSSNPFRSRSGGECHQPGAHARDGGPKVDGGWPGIQQCGRQVLEPAERRVPAATGKPQHHRVGGDDPDGRGPANDHLADRVLNLIRFGALDPHLLGREPALVQEVEDLALGIPPERVDHPGTLSDAAAPEGGGDQAAVGQSTKKMMSAVTKA